MLQFSEPQEEREQRSEIRKVLELVRRSQAKLLLRSRPKRLILAVHLGYTDMLLRFNFILLNQELEEDLGGKHFCQNTKQGKETRI